MFSNGTNVADRENQADFVATPFTIQLTIDSGTDIQHTIVPLNPFDAPVEIDPGFNFSSTIPQSSLSDIIGSEYLTKRIVGNCWAACGNQANPDGAEALGCIFGFGIFVARADGTNPNLPIGGNPALAAGLDANSRSYNPLDSETQREPWMFRRLWMLSTRQPAVNTTVNRVGSSLSLAYTQYPQTTAGYHGIRTGPFFDVKSARRIRQDERLWASFSAQVTPLLETPPLVPVETILINATVDLRILGMLRRAKNRSNF